uniref:J domain-containing protein n=1 Tax=Ananas comosus var. bracteatus TaxID=296719 RepID=A0A6V7PW89_ANACO|nr:unnamed protein product [Ananas comosus var. bracteatus]
MASGGVGAAVEEEEIDHYEVLRLPSGEEGARLTLDQIDKAYKGQSRVRHPDKRPDDPSATADFQRLRASYDVLRDEAARRSFDARLRARRDAPSATRRATPSAASSPPTSTSGSAPPPLATAPPTPPSSPSCARRRSPPSCSASSKNSWPGRPINPPPLPPRHLDRKSERARREGEDVEGLLGEEFG